MKTLYTKEKFAVDWEMTLNEAFQIYREKTSRSSKKVEKVHEFIKVSIEKLSEKKLTCLVNGRSECMKIDGKIYSKRQDIIILRNDKKIAVVSVKFIMQNYEQNANNYLEQVMGECVNIKLLGTIKFIYILIMPKVIPYYEKDGTLVKTEKFSTKHKKPYEFLKSHSNETYAPNWIHIELIKRNQKITLCEKDSFYKFISGVISELLK